MCDTQADLWELHGQNSLKLVVITGYWSACGSFHSTNLAMVGPYFLFVLT